MKMYLVAVKDRQTDQYANPWYVPSVGAAIRAFADEINRAAEDSPLYKHPEDYDLFYLGTWESTTGDIDTTEGPDGSPIKKPLQLAVGANLKR